MREGNEGSGSADTGDLGAPPAPAAPNRVPSELTREYATAELAVQWYAGRCIHSAACIRALPSVFDPRRRPWIDLSAADADAVTRAVDRCPTGALHFTRRDGTTDAMPNQVDGHAPADAAGAAGAGEVEVVAVRDGPYYVRGPVDVVDEAGHVLRRDTRIALCRCGQSKHMPMCDNTHRAVGFRSTRAASAVAEGETE